MSDPLALFQWKLYKLGLAIRKRGFPFVLVPQSFPHSRRSFCPPERVTTISDVGSPIVTSMRRLCAVGWFAACRGFHVDFDVRVAHSCCVSSIASHYFLADMNDPTLTDRGTDWTPTRTHVRSHVGVYHSLGPFSSRLVFSHIRITETAIEKEFENSLRAS